jgi:uncharacterized protein YjbI with pentapeptide repeats
MEDAAQIEQSEVGVALLDQSVEPWVTTRLAALWRPVGAFLIVLAAAGAGLGVYAASQAFWPVLLAWWQWFFAGIAGLIALGAWWLWWRLPKRQARGLDLADDKTRADVEDNFRKTISQIFGGAAVLIAASFAYLQFTDQQRTSQQQLNASHDLLISNQVAKGFELLGNKEHEISQRLGGIYALEGVMNDPTSQQYHRPVLEALSAFVRNETKAKTGDEPPTIDVQAALTVIGRRTAAEGERIIDLTNAHLPKAQLAFTPERGHQAGGPNLSFANLSGAILSHANLTGASLDSAFLNFADLTGASLIGTDLNHALLVGAHFNGAELSGANLSGSMLLSTDLSGADLGGTGEAPNAIGGADLRGADLRGAKLRGAKLRGADLKGAKLSDPELSVLSTDLSDADLSDADLSDADLSGATGLTQEQLDKACGEGAKLDPDSKLTFKDKPCPKSADRDAPTQRSSRPDRRTSPSAGAARPRR